MSRTNAIQNYNQELNQVIQLIQSDLTEELTNSQKVRLQEWLDRSDENKQLYLRIKEGKDIPERLAFRKTISLDEDWNRISATINPQRSLVNRLMPVLGYAAVVAGIIGMAALFLITDYQNSQNYSDTRVQPRSEKVILTLANGDKITLGSKIKQDIVIEQGMSLKDSLGELSYTTIKDAIKHPSQYNTISIPRGGEYKITLEDGTEVYMNSESELKFPDFFADAVRQIELKGEAYLKVSKDKNRPFIVKMNSTLVEVLGTEFNLRSYQDENYSSATLIEGSIKVKTDHKEAVIKPGQQAYIDSDKMVFVKEVDADAVIAWTRGEFVFENKPLETVLNTMARWYDMDFRYENEQIKAYHVTGRLKRCENIMESLATLEKMNVVDFNRNKQVIEVRKVEN